jgi:outer membrane protein OmpA-like peptidoglycan-associated protein
MKRKITLSLIAALLISSSLSGQSETYTVKRAPFSSDKYDEFSPVYYKNGIVFVTNRSSKVVNYSTSENKGLFKINFIDTSGNAGWQNAGLLSKSLKTRFNDGPATFNSRGDTIYYSRNLYVDGSIRNNMNPRNKLGIFSAVADGNKWTKSKDLRFNNEWYNITTPYLSPDGTKLFFASDNPAGHGGSDLYYSEWKANYWDDPVNLGPLINTSGNESYPFINISGGLFFSSDGHPGLGGKDIFYTRFEDDRWLPPIRLDAPINSPYDDFALITDLTMAEGYFSSNRGSSIDIYHYRTNIHQLFYCKKQRTNEYCFKFSDETQIRINNNFQYEWSFGDGTKTVGLNVEHCYPGPGKYPVQLNVVERKSGRVFFTKLSFDLEIKDIEQPVINSISVAIVGQQIDFDGLSSYFPESEILNYTWYFGDGDRTTGKNVKHSYRTKGEYEAKLGLILRQNRTGIIYNACASKQIVVLNNMGEKTAFENQKKAPVPRTKITEYDHAFLKNVYSAEKELNQDILFQVEVLTSKARLDLKKSSVFKNIPSKYSLREIYLPDEKIYSYVVAEEMNLMAVYPAFNDVLAAGYNNTRVRTYILKDPAARDLYAFNKVFGSSADEFFRKNDHNLAPAGTQILDLMIGFMSKYPGIKLEIVVHTDNIGSQTTNQLLSQRRAESMVNYLIINGVTSTRLIAKGLGGLKPIASNATEAERKLNRRVDFDIIRE